MATALNEANEIRSKMAQIRRELHEDVREVVASAEAVTDWHRYLKMYPWVTLAAGFVVGYLIVPRRRTPVLPDIPTKADVAHEVREAVASVRDDPKTKETVKKGLLAGAIGLAAPIAVRAAQGYALRYLEEWIAQQQQQASAGPPPRQPAAPGGPGPGRTRGPGFSA